MYEPTTHLLGAVDDLYTVVSNQIALREVDVAQRKLGPPSTMHIEAVGRSSEEQVTLNMLAPELSGGALAIAISAFNGVMRVVEVDGVKPGGKLHARKTYKLRGALAAVDRAGRVYLFEGHDLVARVGGDEVMRLPSSPSRRTSCPHRMAARSRCSTAAPSRCTRRTPGCAGACRYGTRPPRPGTAAISSSTRAAWCGCPAQTATSSRCAAAGNSGCGHTRRG